MSRIYMVTRLSDRIKEKVIPPAEVCCELGNTAKNNERKVKWYRKAAVQGHAEAQYRLAERYYFDAFDVQAGDPRLLWGMK